MTYEFKTLQSGKKTVFTIDGDSVYDATQKLKKIVDEQVAIVAKREYQKVRRAAKSTSDHEETHMEDIIRAVRLGLKHDILKIRLVNDNGTR
jgi:molybdopterin-guanine dinucleotide biosynthesis protein A